LPQKRNIPLKGRQSTQRSKKMRRVNFSHQAKNRD
jgi:hypothetical protein